MLSKAEEFAAISAVIKNYNNRRAYYGFCYMDEIEPYFDELQQKKEEYSIIPVISDDDNVPSAIIEVAPNYLQKTLISEMPGTIHEGDLKEFVEQNEKNKLLLEKVLLEECDGFSEIIALYNLRYDNIIEYKGIRIKAFGVSIGDALPLFAEYGYQIKAENDFVTPTEFADSIINRDGKAMVEGFRMLPDSNGVLIELKSTYGAQQKAEMRWIFNERYSLDNPFFEN